MNHRIFVSLAALTLTLIACSKSYSNAAPPVPEEVKPFITKTLEKTPGAQPDYKVNTLDSGEIPLSNKAIQVRLQLFEDRRAVYYFSVIESRGGGAPTPLTSYKKTWWSYSNGVISIANIGDFKIDKGQTTGVLTLGLVDSTTAMIPDKLKSRGLPMGMMPSWMKGLE